MILYIDTAFDETIMAVKKDEKIFVEKISKNINISQTLIEKTRYILDKIGKEKQDIELNHARALAGYSGLSTYVINKSRKKEEESND